MCLESGQKSLTYSTLTQGSSEIASVRKQGKNFLLDEESS